MPKIRTFASDNFSPVDPRVLSYLQTINRQGHDIPYGGDRVTEEAVGLFKANFGDDISVLFVPHGTGANILSLKLLLRDAGDAAIVPDSCHVYEMESGALSMQTGAQLFTVPHTDGTVAVEDLRVELDNRRNRSFHSARPAVVSIANATELGTFYTPEDVRAIADFCHDNNMYLHMDGCRLPNAAAAQGLDLRQVSGDLGVDILSFGGAKNGLMNAEAVVIFDAPARDAVALKRLQKQALQLVSKQRYISGQFIPYLRDGIWQENAVRANRTAAALAAGLRSLGREREGAAVHVTRPVGTNQVFCTMPDSMKRTLDTAGHIYCDWISPGEVRFIASWDNTPEDVNGLLQTLSAAPIPTSKLLTAVS